jgi:alpha-galactosidase
MMDDLEVRRSRALKEAMAQPFFDEAIDALRQDLAIEIADCLDPSRADALRAERFALLRLRDRLQAQINKLTMEKIDAA